MLFVFQAVDPPPRGTDPISTEKNESEDGCINFLSSDKHIELYLLVVLIHEQKSREAS